MIKFIKNNFFRIIKFGITGGLGTITNLVVFYITNYFLKINHLICSIIAFSIAVTQNYIINSLWTFSLKKEKLEKINLNGDQKSYKINEEKKLSFQNYFKFVFVSLTGLLMNLLILFILVDIIKFSYKIIAQAVGIIGGMILNYLGSHFIVFKIDKMKK
ncbi:MAG: GtrA family protein [Spirochaetes bacterium]|nr:GtrA family protein [Spirochaetota bacterium]